MKKYERKRVVLWVLRYVVPIVEIRSENERLWAGAKSVRMAYFATESVMGRVRKR